MTMQEAAADNTPHAVNSGLGATLRGARERGHLSVHQAAQDMHVSDDIIEALERDDYASLGAPIFVRGHLRGYARLLDIAEGEVLAAYDKAAGHKPPPPPLITLRPGGGNTFTGKRWLQLSSAAVLALLVALAVSWWLHRPAEEAVPLLASHATPTAVPMAVTLGAPASVVATTGEPPPPTVEPGAKADTGVSDKLKPVIAPGPRPAHQPVKPTAAALTSNQHAPVKPSPVQQSAATTPGLTHVTFMLNQASWIEVYDASGKRLYYELAPAGNNVNISGAGPLQVFLGNAPGVSIELDGAPFDMAPYLRPDHTARFRLGAAGGDGDQAG